MTSVSSATWQPPPLEDIQIALPEFRFEKLIGRGGMGAVYRAVQVALGRTVAVKILPAALIERDDAGYTARFEREARLMGAMNHPGIVSVFGFGRTEDGLLYMVMEHVDGTDLARHLRDAGRLAPDRAAGLIAQVCDALDCAHRAGIIHRDIKPANILLAGDGTVKVADFGLARLEDAAAHGFSKSNLAAGTPEFIAPEALTPGAAVDARADIYALGVVLYQMLTGELPRGRWKLPGERRADARFDAVIRKAMQPDPGARYQSTAALRRELHAIQSAPAAARTSSAWRWLIIPAAAAAVTVAAAIVWSPRAPEVAVPPAHVTTVENDGPGSLREALFHAQQTAGPDTITFAAGLAGRSIPLSEKDIIIGETEGAALAPVIIDATGLAGGLTLAGPLRFTVHATATVTFRGCTFTGGASAYGGIILNSGDLTLTDCVFRDNHAGVNGGALGNNGTLRLTRCSFSGNTAGKNGGALNSLGQIIAEDCTFNGNTGGGGGAVIVGGGTAAFTRCTFAGNEARRLGGALAIYAAVKAIRCTFTGNKSSGTAPDIHGGGAFAFMESAGTLELDACIVAGNTAATGSGPDIWRQSGSVTAVRSLIGIADGSYGTGAADGNLLGTAAAPRTAKDALPGMGGP